MGKAKNLVRESDQRQGSAIVGVNVKAQVNSRLIWLCPHFLSEKSTLPSGCGSFHKTASCDALRLSNHFASICGCFNILNTYSTTQAIHEGKLGVPGFHPMSAWMLELLRPALVRLDEIWKSHGLHKKNLPFSLFPDPTQNCAMVMVYMCLASKFQL